MHLGKADGERGVVMTLLYRIFFSHCGYHTTDIIAFASYIHTESNDHKAPSDPGHKQAHSIFPQLVYKDHSSVYREYHSDTTNLSNARDVHQPR